MENLRNRISDFMSLSHKQQKKLFKIDIITSYMLHKIFDKNLVANKHTLEYVFRNSVKY